MKKLKRIIIILIIFIVLVVVGFISIYFVQTNKVSSISKEIEFEIKANDTYLSIGNRLKEQKLIKSVFFYKLSVKINKFNKLEVGTYSLNQNMNIKKILTTLNSKSEDVQITFKEGYNIRHYASIISSKTNIKEEKFLNILKDEKYLDELINKYWFLENIIKDNRIYHSLEGYLFPDTYNFSKSVTEKEIIEKMLANTEIQLSKYKEKIKNSEYTIHEILSLASMVELEASNLNDRKDVAGVFYNRLKTNMSLGSDVTTYYAEKADITDFLTSQQFNDINDYNTRSVYMKTLPIGPICNMGIESIIASIEPTVHDYYYFVADKYKKTYMTKNQKEHDLKIAELRKAGKWLE